MSPHGMTVSHDDLGRAVASALVGGLACGALAILGLELAGALACASAGAVVAAGLLAAVAAAALSTVLVVVTASTSASHVARVPALRSPRPGRGRAEAGVFARGNLLE